jgi:hypothetical protein
MFSFFEARAQQSGYFDIPNSPGNPNPFFDPATGISRCTINWLNNQSIPPVSNVKINAAIVASDGSCLHNMTDAVPTVIHSGFTGPGYTVTFDDTYVEFGRFLLGGATFNLPTPRPYTPLLILQYRVPAGVNYTINVTGSVNTSNTITPASTTASVPGFTISGTIIKPDFPDYQECTDGTALGTAIPHVNVEKAVIGAPTCFPGLLAMDEYFTAGYYEFEDNLMFTTYRLTPSKSNATEICCGVDLNDYSLFNNNWIIGLETPNNQQWLSADFDGNGALSGNDKFQIANCILENSISMSAAWLPWRFAPYLSHPPTDDYVWTSSIPDYIDVTNTTGFASAGKSFWGVKRGDLNNDCQACGSTLIGPSDDRSVNPLGSAPNSLLLINDLSLSSGQVSHLPVYANEDLSISEMMVEILVDKSALEVLSIEPGALDGAYFVNRLTSVAEGHSVRVAWFDLDKTNIEKQTPLFWIVVKARKEMASIQEHIFLPEHQKRNLLHQNSEAEIKRFVLGFSSQLPQGLSVQLASGNPVDNNQIRLRIQTNRKDNCVIKIADSQNRVKHTQSVDLELGTQEIMLDNLNLPGGLLQLTVQGRDEFQTIKLLKI